MGRNTVKSILIIFHELFYCVKAETGGMALLCSWFCVLSGSLVTMTCQVLQIAQQIDGDHPASELCLNWHELSTKTH